MAERSANSGFHYGVVVDPMVHAVGQGADWSIDSHTDLDKEGDTDLENSRADIQEDLPTSAGLVGTVNPLELVWVGCNGYNSSSILLTEGYHQSQHLRQ